MTKAEHCVATTRGLDRSLVREERAAWLWARLRRALPDAYSCVFMPDHLHLVLPPGRSDRFRRVLRAFTARYGVRFDFLPPENANTAAIMLRMIRYGFCNPVRAGLVMDPWAWQWSTLRDLGCAAYPVWTSLKDLARVLRVPVSGALGHLTKTADQAPFIPILEPVNVANAAGIPSAVAATLRIPYAQTIATPRTRNLVIQLCRNVSAGPMTKLAAPLGSTPSAIYKAHRVPHPALSAALLCLSDPRLHSPIKQSKN